MSHWVEVNDQFFNVQSGSHFTVYGNKGSYSVTLMTPNGGVAFGNTETREEAHQLIREVITGKYDVPLCVTDRIIAEVEGM